MPPLRDLAPKQQLTSTVQTGDLAACGAADSARPASSLLPIALPPPLLELLGTGGMGTVHLVADETLAREVALKRMHPQASAEESSRAAFVHEARMTGQLQHPNIVPVYGLYADADGTPFFLMQVVEGQTLRAWLALQAPSDEPDSPRATSDRTLRGIEILVRVCDALAFAHSRGILHRDIKPENVMVGPHGRVYLLDWGVAERVTGAERPQLEIAGTPNYMAPEQARGKTLDERVDVFGVGAILYELVAGYPPYGKDPHAVMLLAAQGQIVPISEACRGRLVSPRLLSIIETATAADREQRFASIPKLQHELLELLRGGPEMVQVQIAAGKVIVAEGEHGDCAYLVASGSCRVIQGSPPNERVLRDLHAGDIFGELALVLEQPRSASVVALEPTTLLRIDRAGLAARGEFDCWSATLLRALATRFLQLEQQLRPG